MFSAHSRLRHAVADTFAMVVYCTVVNMMIEIFLSGMTFEQSLSSRLVAIPVNIIIAVPYGIYRDFAMRQARRISPARWMKNMACWPTSPFSRRCMSLFCGAWVLTGTRLSPR